MLSEIRRLRLGKLLQTGDQCYYNILTVPNLITLSGFLCLFSYLYSAVAGNYFLMSLSLFWCFVSDAFDGAAARYFKQHSWLGIRIDPLRDRMLFVTLVAHLLFIKGIEAMHWQLGPILALELAIILMAIHYSKPHVTLKASLPGKARHGVSVMLMSMVIFDDIYGPAILDSAASSYYSHIAKLCQRLDICYYIILIMLAITAGHYWHHAKKNYS